MSFVAGNFDNNGNAIMMLDSIGITNMCASMNVKVTKHFDSRYNTNIYTGFSGTIDACELMVQSFVNSNITYDAPKYKLIKEINDWLTEFVNEYNIHFDLCSFICMFKNRFIVVRFCDKETPYDIYITDSNDVNKNPTAIGAGLDTYAQFIKLFDGTKYNNYITFEEIFMLVTYKNINTNFPVYKIDPSNDTVTIFNNFNDEGNTINIDEFNFVNV